MASPLDGISDRLRSEILRIWDEQVAGGSERYKLHRDFGGRAGQREISRLLKDDGIGEKDERWRAIIAHGRSLYYAPDPMTAPQPGPTSARPPEPTPAESPAPPPSTTRSAPRDEGLAYTKGASFRARAEASQRRFRAEVLGAGCAKYGHLLDEEAIAAGANFLHPAARASAEARAGAGKGVDPARTFGNMLSSQAMAFNLFAPLAADLDLATAVLAPFVPGLGSVRSIELEHTPAADVFRDQSKFGGVDCDVLVEFEARDRSRGVLVVETKFVEPSFSHCGHRKPDARDPCPQDVVVGDDFQGCRYARKNKFLYWQRSAETKALRLPLARNAGCPFSGPLWQLWVNHTLAHVVARRRGASRAAFAVLASSGNDALDTRARVEEFRRHVTDPSTVLLVDLDGVLTHLQETVAARGHEHRNWAERMSARYLVAEPRGRGLITEGHRRVAEWMATPAFGELVAVHRQACGARASIYFRPTDKGLVRIGLHPKAPAYLGFRMREDESGYLVKPGSKTPPVSEIEARFKAFEAWLPSVGRRSDEEQGVIPWLARALEEGLALPDLGKGWVFLHQEWRFVADDGIGKKSDILAVHLPTGRLGIVEFKSDASKLAEARTQVDDYARFWRRDASELAPFFTTLLRAMGVAYGNKEAALGSVSTEPATVFVGVASPGRRVHVERR
jgi:hypothetical protein